MNCDLFAPQPFIHPSSQSKLRDEKYFSKRFDQFVSHANPCADKNQIQYMILTGTVFFMVLYNIDIEVRDWTSTKTPIQINTLLRMHTTVYIYIYIYIYIKISFMYLSELNSFENPLIKYIHLIYIYLLLLFYNSSILDIEHSPFYIALGLTQTHKVI